jgi:hypothetical protein
VQKKQPKGRTIGRGEFCFADGAMGLGEDRWSGIALMVKASAMLWTGSYLFEGGVGGAGGFSKTCCCMLFRTVAVGEAIVDLLYSTALSMGEAYGFVAFVLMICELGYCSRLSSFDRFDGKKRPQQDGQEPIDVSGTQGPTGVGCTSAVATTTSRHQHTTHNRTCPTKCCQQRSLLFSVLGVLQVTTAERQKTTRLQITSRDCRRLGNAAS